MDFKKALMKQYICGILRKINEIKSLLILKAFVFASLFCPQKTYWVICERGVDARDNGWHFYNFMKKYHPETKVYYIIDKNVEE